MLPVEQPFKTYTGLDGKPLDNGYVYFGQPNQDPANVSKRVTVYWDAAGTQPAFQPLRTVGGYIMNNGTPANVFFDGAYSELVRDSKMRQVFYARTSDDFSISTLVQSLFKATGSALVGFIQKYIGAVVRTLQDKAAERVSPLDFGAKGDGVSDDSTALEKCVNSGARKIDYCGLDYKITRPINQYTGGVTHDMRGARFVQATANASAFIVGYNGNGFVKTDDVTFIGGTLIGADNGLTTTVSVGISVYGPPVVPYAEGAGCSRIKVIDANFDNFCMSIAATGADGLDIEGIYSTSMQYHPAASAGGYGVLAQTCFNVRIGERCVFKGGPNSRHAVYISADPSRAKDANNVCRKVHIGACLVDWDAVTGVTGFETGIFIRGAFDITVDGPTVRGGFGGVLYDLENAPGENITFRGIQALNVRAKGGENCGVGFTRSSGTYRAKNVTSTGHTIQLGHANTHGLQYAYIDGLTSSGHTIGRKTDSYISGIYTNECTNVTLDSSTIAGNFGVAAMMFYGPSDNVAISRPSVSGAGPKYRFFTVPTNLSFTYPRTFVVTADGAGNINAVSYDGEVLTAQISTDANGFSVTLPPEQSPTPNNFAVLSLGSQIANVYHRAVDGQTVTFGVLGVPNGAPVGLVALPAATNAYAVQITVLH